MVNVRKADGTVRPFNRENVLRTCHRLRLSASEAEEVVAEIEQKLFEGITTKRILEMIFEHGQRHRPHLAHMVDLREALSLMRPKPDFEKFVAIVLEHEGYRVATNKIVPGKCVEHEIDVIATKGSETIYIEVKHHFQFHTFTGLDIFLQANSTFEDLVQGYLSHSHQYNFTKPMIVLNTRISEHARRYAACRGIGAMGWNIPQHAGLERHIDQRLLYPVTVLRSLDAATLGRLGDNGVYTLKQLVDAEQRDLSRDANIDAGVLSDLVDKARAILSS